MAISPAVGQPTSGRTRALGVAVSSTAHSRSRVLAYELGWLGLLALLAYLYIGEHWIWVDSVDGARPTYDTIGSLEVAVLWFGALGGVFVSLTAVADYRGLQWDPTYEQWHVLRPIVGAVMGAVAVLIFQAGILATGESVTPDTGATLGIFYFLIAFLVGYREGVFRKLLKRVADVILTPEGETSGGLTITPTAAKANPEQPAVLTISGPGAEKVKHVLVDGVLTNPLSGSTANAVLVEVPPEVTPGDVEVAVIVSDAPPAFRTIRIE